MKRAQKVMIGGAITLLLTPVAFYVFAFVVTSTCPDYGRCGFELSLAHLAASFYFAIIWAIVSIFIIARGLFVYMVNKKA